MAADKSENKKITPITGRIVNADIVREMQESYIDYAMSVIIARALPDVRDGLKPVHRRILYSMHELGLGHQAKFRKSALVVGDVLGKYHPHGDAACYDALVRMAQDFNLLHPLVIGQGNFGSIDGDPPAAMRYTEVKLAPLASELLRDLEKETVAFTPNYDNSRQEPALLPAAIPNLLINGTVGIAVGMATKVLPHNLSEVMEALIHLADQPEAAAEDLMKFIKGPDFPTGGLVFGERDIHHASATGRGGVVVRGETEVVEVKSGTFQIVISSIPYQLNKADLIVKIADLVREKRLEGIRDIREESTTLNNMRIVIDLKSDVAPEPVINALYKNTELETVFHYNMLALVDGVPRLLSLKAILEEFLKHRREVVTKRITFDLTRAREREHILLGLKRAIDVIDEIIATIKKSADAPEAHRRLMGQFKFSALQATAILELRLQKLAGLEIKKIREELTALQAQIGEWEGILADPKKVLAVVKSEFVEIKNHYGQPRRTKVIPHGAKEINIADLVPDKDNILVVTAGGYLKRADPAEYRSQRRGGVGVIDVNIKEEDFVSIFLTANTHSDLLFFTNRGKVYRIKMYEVPEGKRATRGKSVMNFLPLSPEEKITSVLAVPTAAKGKKLSLLMITQQGVAKKVSLESFTDVRRSGIIAITLEPGNALLSAHLVEASDEVIIATAAGQAIRFRETDIRAMGRTATGVRAIKLAKTDAVIAASVIKAGNRSGEFLVLTENGYGKKSKLNEYKVQKRGGSGIKTVKITSKTGRLTAGKVVEDAEDEIMAISKLGQVIRTKLAEIPTLGRTTQGVRVMRLRAGDRLASLTFL